MKKSLHFIVLTASVLLMQCFTSCRSCQRENDATGELKGSITVSGAFALYPMVVKWAEEFQKVHPGVRIDVSAGGAGKGMADVLSGMVEIAMVSRGINEEEVKKGAWKIAVTKDAVLPTMNASSPALSYILKNGISKKGFESIFLSGRKMKWSDLVKGGPAAQVNVYTRSDACGAAEMWAKYLGTNQEDLLGIGVFGDPGIADAVKKDVNGIGYNNVAFAYDLNTRKPNPGIAIIPIDMNENGMADPDELFYGSLDSVMMAIRRGVYPSPPARELYLVTKGKPGNVIVVEFIRWILTEGQKYVDHAGYVRLDEDVVSREIQKLN